MFEQSHWDITHSDYSKKGVHQNPRETSMMWVLIKETILMKMLYIYDKESKSFIEQDVSCSPTSSMKQND